MTTTITHRTGTYYGGTCEYIIIEATDNSKIVSALYANPATGQIMQIETIPARRREGLATALLDYAEDHSIELYHSPEEHRTREGQAWAESTDHIDTVDPELAYQP